MNPDIAGIVGNCVAKFMTAESAELLPNRIGEGGYVFMQDLVIHRNRNS